MAEQFIKTSILVDAGLWDRLGRVARARNVSRSVIMREAIGEKLDRLERGRPVLEEPDRLAERAG